MANEGIQQLEIDSEKQIWDMLEAHMIGAMRGAACYIIYSGVPDDERAPRFTDFISGYLWSSTTENENLERILEQVSQERDTRTPMPDRSHQNEAARQGG